MSLSIPRIAATLDIRVTHFWNGYTCDRYGTYIASTPCVRVCCWLKCCFTSTETVGLLGTGTQDVHLDFHTAPELCKSNDTRAVLVVLLRSAVRT